MSNNQATKFETRRFSINLAGYLNGSDALSFFEVHVGHPVPQGATVSFLRESLVAIAVADLEARRGVGQWVADSAEVREV